ncbi:MAG: EamA family transporter [Saprospiraceae bacterium]|nr:DMT family transporter [Bacteroidia bacterium]NNE14613.1 EamA family transporter [Saprospiraceae bacterium]NNL92516.1 EamA family transporter [Saprospiraceae bacterium]
MKNIFQNPKALTLLTISMWALFGVLIKLVTSSNTFFIIAIALWAASIINLIYFLKNRKPRNSETKVGLGFIFFAACGYFIYWVLLLNCIILYEDFVSVPLVLNYTWPLFTVLISIVVFKVQKFNIITIISMAIGFLGIIILGSEGNIENLKFSKSILGLILGVGSGFAYGIFSAYASTLSNKLDTSKLLLTGSLIGAIGLTVISYFKYGLHLFDLSTLDLVVAFSLGLFLDGFAYITWTRALAISVRDKIDISISANLVNFLPLYSIALMGIFYLDERSVMSKPYFLLAFGLVLISSLIPNYLRKNN